MPSTQCPLRPVNDRICVAAQYVAMGQNLTCRRGLLSAQGRPDAPYKRGLTVAEARRSQ